MIADSRACWSIAGLFGLVDRQLPERVHLPAAARQVGRVPAVGLRQLPARAALVREHPGGELGGARRQVRALQGADLDPVSARRAGHRPCCSWRPWRVTPVGPLLAARLLFACALIVLFAIDLEHQILPNVITLPGIVVGLAFALVGPPGLARRR